MVLGRAGSDLGFGGRPYGANRNTQDDSETSAHTPVSTAS